MWRRQDPAESQVVAECESFLTGTYAETVDDLGGAVPAWGWVNLLAHGSAAELREATGVPSHPAFGGGAAEWWRARAFLVGEVLDLVDAGQTTLVALQRDTLVPLELDLASRSPGMRVQPGDLVMAVLAALPERSPRREHR